MSPLRGRHPAMPGRALVVYLMHVGNRTLSASIQSESFSHRTAVLVRVQPHGSMPLGVALLDLPHQRTASQRSPTPLTSLSFAALTLFPSFSLRAPAPTRRAGLSGKSVSAPLTSFFSALNPFESPAADLWSAELASSRCERWTMGYSQPKRRRILLNQVTRRTHRAQNSRACSAYGSSVSDVTMGETHPCSLASSNLPYTHRFQSVRTQYLHSRRLAAPHVRDQYHDALDLVL